jgi:hypothetical protein
MADIQVGFEEFGWSFCQLETPRKSNSFRIEHKTL